MSPQQNRRRRLRRAGIACVLTVGTLFATGGTGATGATAMAGTSATTAVPTAEQQLDWLVAASTRLPIPAAELRQHVSAVALTAVGGPDGFNAAVAKAAPLRLDQIVGAAPTEVEALLTGQANATLLTVLEVDPTGLIDGLRFGRQPTSWTEVSGELNAIAPDVSFATSVIEPDGRCRQVEGSNSDIARPLGSSFKLYVLGALGQAVTDHRASWSEELPIHEEWKSLPSGVLQNEPAGTELPLRQYADDMISISDNTAADHLIHFLGRDAVQRQLYRFGQRRPLLNTPFLTTRDLFALKSVDYPTGANAYLALPRQARGLALTALERIPRSSLSSWAPPRDVDQVEWFASPADICRAYSGLWQENARPGDSDIGAALSINNGGIALPTTEYPTIWFKGGSEPGVLTVNYLTRTADGRILVCSIMLSDPKTDTTDPGEVQALAVARGAIMLTDRATR